jgi:succinate dehydrogenase hydrophobic anchor subunit
MLRMAVAKEVLVLVLVVLVLVVLVLVVVVDRERTWAFAEAFRQHWLPLKIHVLVLLVLVLVEAMQRLSPIIDDADNSRRGRVGLGIIPFVSLGSHLGFMMAVLTIMAIVLCTSYVASYDEIER